jgi:hypothetical protein
LQVEGVAIYSDIMNPLIYSPLTEKTEPMPADIGWRGSIISVKGLYIRPVLCIFGEGEVYGLF